MPIKDILYHLNNLRSKTLGSRVQEHGSDEVVIYKAELEALDEAIELLKEMED